jgi:predicted metal-dependent peptidase
VIRKIIERKTRKARDEAQQAGQWGNLPGHYRDMIDEALRAKIDWRKELRKISGEALRRGTVSTRKRPHRRFRFDAPGRKPKYTGYVVVAVDTSASVQRPELRQFRGEIDRMSTRMPVVVIDFDTQIHRVYQWHPKLPTWEPEGGGGTNFQHIFDAVTEKKAMVGPQNLDPHRLLKRAPGAIVVLTDGDAPAPTFALANKIPTLWVVTRSYNRDKVWPFGRNVYLEMLEEQR